VIDKKAFLQAAVNDNNLVGFITVDLSALNRVAGATKGAVNYPGSGSMKKKF